MFFGRKAGIVIVWCRFQPFSITAFSPCGNYLAAVAGGDICVWDINLQTQLECFKHERGYSVTALAWNPKVRGEIAYCDVRGQLGTIENCVPADGVPRSVPEIGEKVPFSNLKVELHLLFLPLAYCLSLRSSQSVERDTSYLSSLSLIPLVFMRRYRL